MKISIICNHIYIGGGWSPSSIRIGGSEECIVEWARRLEDEHDVQVFHNGQHGIYEGVMYRPHIEYEPGDITINVNYPEFDPQGKTIYWTSLTNNSDLDKFDAVCGISEYAVEHTNLPDRTTLIPPGYDETKIKAEKKIPKQCLYASSPDRGLDILLQAWPEVYKAHPDATLLVTYGAEATPMPGVTFLGEVDEETMNDLYNTSDIWSYPCIGGELYCMVGKKAQVAGCIPVIIPTMALAETVERGFKTDIKGYAQSLIEVLNLSEKARDTIRRDITAHSNATTWDESTDILLKLINQVLK